MRHLVAALAAALLTVALPATVKADPANYGIESVGASLTTQQAGGHPDFTSDVTLKTESGDLPALTKDVTIDLPPGLLANPDAVPRCSLAQFVSTDLESKAQDAACPQDSQVGVTHVVFSNAELGTTDYLEPVFNLEPRVGEPARLGFIALQYPIIIDTELRPDYGVTAKVRGADTLATLYKTETTLWGVPADESHDGERMTPYEGAHNRGAIETPTGTRQSGIAPVPFMLNPTRCTGPFSLAASVTNYSEPERLSEGEATLPLPTGCGLLEFSPDLSLTPTTSRAASPTGMNASLAFPTGGLQDPSLLGEDEQRRVEVVLPEGMTVNPSQATGLGACSQADFARERASSAPGEGCPEDSKIGTVSATTPLLGEEVVGSLYVATPHANPFGSLIALYMVLRAPERGVVVKLPGRVAADPSTGQLTATFGEAPFEIPQLPISEFRLHFREGPRAPLVTPSGCGTYAATATFTSWGGHTVSLHPSFEVTAGAEGLPCPSGLQAFGPSLVGRSLNSNAASYSPFYLRFSRNDAEPELTRFSATLPTGEVAKLAGVAHCPQAAIAAARSIGGTAELAEPSCPLSSRIGRIEAGAGVGSSLTYVPGSLYLAGPYRGSPLSVAAIVPAVAGPFDLGTVVVQEPLGLDPESGRAVVDGSSVDPLPRILDGIPLRLRDVRVYLDRPEFTLSPTSCAPLATDAVFGGAGGFDSDEVIATGSARYQAANCMRLPFAPKLSLSLKGKTQRGGHPALRAVLRGRKGDANIAFAWAALPHSEFLAQEHIKTICTRVQFAAERCPSGSVYGHARAFSPLLDHPLEGPVYLRSSTHLLPDLVADLSGEVHIVLVGRIDTFDQGIRTTFSKVPDAPVSKFVLSMQGGKKGLLVNSTDLCAGSPDRAHIALRAQNGRRAVRRPVLRSQCGKSSHGHPGR